MKRSFWLWFVLQSVAAAQIPVLTHMETPGRIVWTNTPDTNALYRVEWASSPQGPWNFTFDSLGGSEFRAIQGGTNTQFSAEVPILFRVCMITSAPPPGMVLIPGGSFEMGNHFTTEADDDQLPVHTVILSPFWISRTEVTRGEWDRVLKWGLNNGYRFSTTNCFDEVDPDLPVVGRCWYDVAKWCNARSEMEGRQSAYWYAEGMFAIPYRTGVIATVEFWMETDGYRLPTEAEWEYAARGGLSGKRFPCGNTIGHAQENYFSTGAYDYDISTTRGDHPAFTNRILHYAPSGQLSPNGYGLYDMGGNVREMCSDRYASNYYAWGVVTNPPGPSGVFYPYRVSRGGAAGIDASLCRVAMRMYVDPEDLLLNTFRLVIPNL